MAKKDELLLKLEIQESKQRDKIDNLKNSLKELDGRTREYKRTVKELELAEINLNNTKQQRLSRESQLNTQIKQNIIETQKPQK